jgi:predicted nucleotidyltransferase
MAQRPKGCETKVLTADGSVYSGTKNIYSIQVSYAGATEGDKIAIRETGATGAVKILAVIPTDNGTLDIPCGRYGIEVANAYYTELATAAGKIWATVIFG